MYDMLQLVVELSLAHVLSSSDLNDKLKHVVHSAPPVSKIWRLQNATVDLSASLVDFWLHLVGTALADVNAD
jgi:hypothetical protein